MKNPDWGLVLGLLLAPADVLAQGVVTATISVDTGSCAPATSTKGLASNGGVGGGVGASGLTGGTGGISGAGAATETGGNGVSASGVPNGNGGNGTGSGTTSNPSSDVKLSVDSNSNSGLYTYSGFYPLPANGSLLNGAVTATGARWSGFMTLESCAYACQGVPFFAVEQGYMCECGTIAPTSTPVNNPSMTIACAGDLTEICGAPGFGIVYRGSPPSSSVIINTSTVPLPTPNGSVTIFNQISTTDSMGSTTVEMSTATSSGPEQGSVTVVSDMATTDLLSSTVVEPITAVISVAGQSDQSTTAAVETSSAAGSVAAASTPGIPSLIASPAAVTSSSMAPGALPTTAPGPGSLLNSSSSDLPAAYTPVPSMAASLTVPAATTGSVEPTLVAVPSCPASGPNSNNTRYVDLFDNTYDIRCGIDVVSSQRTSAHADNFLRCLQYCDLLDGCVGVTFVDEINKYNNNTNCNSYYTFEGYSPVSQQAGGYLYSGVNIHGPSYGVVDPSSGQNTTDDLCAAPVTNNYGPDVYGSCYQIDCDQTINQGTGGALLATTVLSSLLACSLYCSFYNNCVSVTWNGPFVAGQSAPNCFPKSSYNTTVATAEVGTSYAFNGKCPGQ